MTFKIEALPAEPFAPLFALSDDALRAQGARRMRVDSQPGFPCRISLEDAPLGETVLLVNYEHQANVTPYRASHAVFVREGVARSELPADTVPSSLRERLLSVRAFDSDHLMVDADVVDGQELEAVVERFFSSSAVTYLHVHYAKRGCYAARVTRAAAA